MQMQPQAQGGWPQASMMPTSRRWRLPEMAPRALVLVLVVGIFFATKGRAMLAKSPTFPPLF